MGILRSEQAECVTLESKKKTKKEKRKGEGKQNG
jgi:hypothetical protein